MTNQFNEDNEAKGWTDLLHCCWHKRSQRSGSVQIKNQQFKTRLLGL